MTVPRSLRDAGPAIGGLVLVASYVILYPIHGFHVALGSDTPVYVWWARSAGAIGFGPLGTGARPGTTGLVAVLTAITRTPTAAVVAALEPALGAAAGMAAAALIDAALGPEPRRLTLAGLLTGAFLSLMVAGYLSTLAFAAPFLAAMTFLALAVREPGQTEASALEAPERRAGWRPAAAPTAAAVLLVAAAGLAHPEFLALGAGVLAGGLLALLVPAARSAGRSRFTLRGGPARVLAVAAAGTALVGLGLVVSGAFGSPAVDTSRDAVLRATGLGSLLRVSYLHKLRHDWPVYRAVVDVGAAATALAAVASLRRPDPERGPSRRLFWGLLTAWTLISVGGLLLLPLGTAAPAQRLADFCLPLPMLAALGLAYLWRSRAALAAVVTAAVLVVSWLAWGGNRPLVTPQALSESRAAAALVADRPPGTPLVVVMSSASDKPALFVTRAANYVRDALPPARIGDLRMFVGTPADYEAGRPGRRPPSAPGGPEYDRMAVRYFAQLRDASAASAPIAVSIRAFDPGGYRAAQRVPGALLAGPGVVLLPPPRGGAAASPAPGQRSRTLTALGAGPTSPWLPLWLGPLLLILVGVGGLPWTLLAARGRLAPGALVALAPAVGSAAIGLAAVAVDAFGLRLDGAGAVAAAIVALAGWPLVAVRRAVPGRRTPPPPAAYAGEEGTAGSNAAGSAR